MNNMNMTQMKNWKSSTIAAIAAGVAGLVAAGVLVPWMLSDARATKAISADKRWQAVAPGRIEPLSGEIRIATPIPGVVGQVLVKVNDKVFAGEPLVRLQDNEVLARLAAAEMQVALRKRARNDQSASGKTLERRKAEDAVADGEKAAVEARVALDRAAIALRAGTAPETDVDTARSALTQTKDKLGQLKADLRKIEADAPLPIQLDGQLNIARSELVAAEAAAEKLTIRAPVAGSILQINVKAGELAAPSALQPLILLGDISALRVRAELDERDFGEIKIGQPVVVRSSAFRGRDFAGKVSFVAPLIEHGRGNLRGPRSPTDVDVVEVMVDLTEPGPLATGMKVDAYFSR